MFLRFVLFTFWNYYVLKLLRLETITFSDAMLSDINVVLWYVLSQYPSRSLCSPRQYIDRTMNPVKKKKLRICEKNSFADHCTFTRVVFVQQYLHIMEK